MNNQNQKNKIKFKDFDNDEINLKFILNTLLRNRIFICSVTFLFVIISSLYAVTRKRIWEGQFEIVLSNQEDKGLSAAINPALQGLLELQMGSSSKDLQTEVAILESPSVLLPTFNLVNQERLKLEPNLKKLDFKKWKKNNLFIKLKKNTSVLQIAYRDENKDLILPVLKKMTSTYQEYSGSSKRRNQELTKNFLSEQISIFKQKSKESIKAVQEFSIDQDLLLQDLYEQGRLINNSSNKDQDFLESQLLLPNIGIENIRVQAANQIRKIDLQIAKIKDIGQDLDQLQYIGYTIPSLFEGGWPESLRDIEEQIVEMSSKYTKKDQSVTRIIEKRDLLINLIKNRAIGILKAQKLIFESQMESAMRPKGVLIKYKELIREAARDEKTLVQLENQLRFVKLEESKLEDPWELISLPTLIDYPIAPSRKNIVFIGLIAGLFASSTLALIKDKRKGIIFEKEILENVLNCQIIDEISIDDLKEKYSKLSFLEEYLNTLSVDQINFIATGEITKVFNNNLSKALSRRKSNKKFYFENSIFELKNSISQGLNLIVVHLGSFKYSDVKDLNKKLNILNSFSSGIILIKEKL